MDPEGEGVIPYIADIGKPFFPFTEEIPRGEHPTRTRLMLAVLRATDLEVFPAAKPNIFKRQYDN
jgi:hypothetical protein